MQKPRLLRRPYRASFTLAQGTLVLPIVARTFAPCELLPRLLFLAPMTGIVDQDGHRKRVLGWSFERGEVEFVERFIEPVPLIGFGEAPLVMKAA